MTSPKKWTDPITRRPEDRIVTYYETVVVYEKKVVTKEP